MQVGHLLRDATPERAPSGAPTRVKIAIVGAGPSGLSAAWRLERLGEKDFVVLELEARAGGTSTYGDDGVVPYPWAAHYVPLPTRDNRALVALLSELDVFDGTDESGDPRAKEELLVRAPEERVFADGEWHEGLYPNAIATDEDKAELLRFKAETARFTGWRDGKGRAAFDLPLRRSSDDAELTALDRVTAAAWLSSRGFDSKLLRWYVEYACRDDYGTTLETTSAWAMLFYFCSRVPAPGRDSEPFITWPEGNGRLVQHLTRVAGERLKTGVLVTDVVPRDKDVELSVIDVASGALSRIVAEQVVLAVPKFLVRRLLRPWREKPPEHLSAFSYGSWWVANVHLRRRPRSTGFGFAWDNVIYDSPSLGYVVATHQRMSDYGPTIWTYYRPLVGEPAAERQRLSELGHADFCQALIADLEPAHVGLRDAIERVDVWRWGHAMARPVPGMVWGPARKKAAEPFGRVHFAHSDLSAVGLFEEAQDHGVRAAEQALAATGREVQSILG